MEHQRVRPGCIEVELPYGGEQGWLSCTFTEVKARTSTSVSTRRGDRQGRLGAVNLGPFVGVKLNL